MRLNINNSSKSNHTIFNKLKKKDFFFEEFENNFFFKPFLDSKYFEKLDYKKLVNNKNKVHVFGMGGSSLSSKLLIQFKNTNDLNSKIFIYDNPYDELIEKNLSHRKITNNDKFIFISKSGKTVETKYFLEYIEKYLVKIGLKNPKKNFIFITENTNNFLNNYGKKNNIICFEHDPNIGGRFSVFSITGLLPLILIGYDLTKLVNEAKKAFQEIKKDKIKIGKFLLDFYSSQKINKTNIFIGLSYNQKLSSINEWYRQIFAESLGKNNKAITYISSLGPIDQHSQFQLYIDGPQDKSYLFFKLIDSKTQILNTLYEGARKTLIDDGNLVSSISIENNYKSYNKLIILLIFDIFLRSRVENINFLDQPAVEILKKNTKI